MHAFLVLLGIRRDTRPARSPQPSDLTTLRRCLAFVVVGALVFVARIDGHGGWGRGLIATVGLLAFAALASVVITLIERHRARRQKASPVS